MRNRDKPQLRKVARYAMRRWVRSRHQLNYLVARQDRELDAVRAMRAEQRWFAAVERTLRLERIAA